MYENQKVHNIMFGDRFSIWIFLPYITLSKKTCILLPNFHALKLSGWGYSKSIAKMFSLEDEFTLLENGISGLQQNIYWSNPLTGFTLESSLGAL